MRRKFNGASSKHTLIFSVSLLNVIFWQDIFLNYHHCVLLITSQQTGGCENQLKNGHRGWEGVGGIGEMVKWPQKPLQARLFLHHPASISICWYHQRTSTLKPLKEQSKCGVLIISFNFTCCFLRAASKQNPCGRS